MRKNFIAAICSAAFIFVYAIFVEPYWIQVNEIEIAQEPFAAFFKTYKTIFLSDIHVSKLGIREERLLKIIKNIDPDIILIGGDCTPWDGDYSRTFEFLYRLKPKIGIWGVLGESDYQNSRNSCRFCHSFSHMERPLPIRFLQNQTMKYNADAPTFVGLDIFPLDNNDRQEVLVELLAGAGPSVLLTHKQVNLEVLPTKPILVLSGDTHGGQMWMPNLLWQRLFGETKGVVRHGKITSGGNTLVVSSGIGTSRFPFHLFSPPEVVLLKGL